jgi:hypothetical protein
MRAIFDASSYEQGEQALSNLAAHPWGNALACFLHPLLDAALMHLLPCHQGLLRVSPEWYWRDFRQRLSRGRNHGSNQRLERASLIWAVYYNFTPAQRRYEHKRHYRRPGQSPLDMAEGPALRLECPQARSATLMPCIFEQVCTISPCPSNKTRTAWGPLLALFNTNTLFFLPTQDATESALRFDLRVSLSTIKQRMRS